jgi:hypothetical protein
VRGRFGDGDGLRARSALGERVAALGEIAARDDARAFVQAVS